VSLAEARQKVVDARKLVSRLTPPVREPGAPEGAHLDHILPATGDVAKVERHASLFYTEISAFWPRRQIQDRLGARALELTILPVCRSGRASRT
jgi:hypothetical protein